MNENTFQLFPCDIVAPCESFQCYGRAEYFLGRRQAPKTTLKNICGKCANELIESIVAPNAANPALNVGLEVEADPFSEQPSELPFEPTIEDLLEIGGKLVIDMNLKDLKAACKSLGLSGYSDKNRDELIALLDEATNDIAVKEHAKGNL